MTDEQEELLSRLSELIQQLEKTPAQEAHTLALSEVTEVPDRHPNPEAFLFNGIIHYRSGISQTIEKLKNTSPEKLHSAVITALTKQRNELKAENDTENLPSVINHSWSMIDHFNSIFGSLLFDEAVRLLDDFKPPPDN